jgi:hypothetical protein
LFKAKFQTLVESKHLPPEEKAVILVDNLEKDPLKLATAVVAGKFKENSLQRIWESLEEHYGGERRRKTMPLQRLRSMSFITKFNRQELLNFHVILTEIRSHYASTDEDKLWEENSEIVSLARERISEARQSEYLSHLRYLHRKDNFISLCNWIKEKLEIHHNVEETSVIKKAGERSFRTVEETDRVSKGVQSGTGDMEEITAAGQEHGHKLHPSQRIQSSDNLHQSTLESLGNKSSQPPVQTQREKPICLFCKKEHPLYSCEAFDKIEHQEKNKFVRANRVCYHCLNPGHVAAKCDYFPGRVCNLEGCQGSHHRKLHPPKSSSCFGYEEEYPDERLGAELSLMNSTQPEETNYGANGTYVAIRTVPVILKSGGKKKRVIVALDACSNNTNISEGLAEELGLKKLKGGVARSVGYLERTVKFKSDMVQFNLCPLDESSSHPVFAWTIKDLVKNTPVVDWKKEIARYPHLRDLKVPDKQDGDSVDILLGTDYAHLMAVTSSHVGKPGEPIAERTALGLAFSGKLKNCISKKEDASNFCYNGVTISLDYITLTNLGDPPEETVQNTEEGWSPVVDASSILDFEQGSELLSACDSMIEDYGPPLDYSHCQILFLKPGEKIVQGLVARPSLVSKKPETWTSEEVKNHQVDCFPWFLGVQRGCETTRKKRSEEQRDLKLSDVMDKLDHTTLRRLLGLLLKEALQESGGLKWAHQKKPTSTFSCSQLTNFSPV